MIHFFLCNLHLAPHKSLILKWNLSVLVKTNIFIWIDWFWLPLFLFLFFEWQFTIQTNQNNWNSPILRVGLKILERFSRAGPRGRGREWATLGEHPLTWLLSNNQLEKVPFVSVLHTSSNRLLLSNQNKGCTPSVAHSLPLPLGPALLNLWTDNSTPTIKLHEFSQHLEFSTFGGREILMRNTTLKIWGCNSVWFLGIAIWNMEGVTT